MARLRRDPENPSEDGRGAGNGPSGRGAQSGWLPGRTAEQAAGWPSEHQWPTTHWPVPSAGYGPGRQPTPPARYPAWPAAYGATAPQPTYDDEHAAAVAAAEATEAARVVGRNGHLDGIPLGRIKVIERFQGPRLKHRTTVWRRLRSLVLLLAMGLLLAAVLAAVLALIVWAVSTGVHAATTG